MSVNKLSGDLGEQEVVKLVLCPNCNKKLMFLPASYPLYDIQCTGCTFRAQVKTNLCKPKSEILGAGWDIMEKVLKAGFISPALFLNFKWTEKNRRHQEIRFYPFIPKINLKKRFTVVKKPYRELWMFNYIGMNEVPHFVLYKA
jgi:hypothetical protein